MTKPDSALDRPDPSEITPEHAIVRFMGRLMTGYETMAQRLIEQASIASEQLAATQKGLARQTEVQLKMVEQYEELLSLRHERELKALESEADRKLKGAIVSDLRALAPLVVKKFAGLPLNDGSGFKDLVGSISAEQFEAMVSGQPVTFSDAQRELLIAALDKEAKKEEADAAE